MTRDVWFAGAVAGGANADAFLHRVRQLAPAALTGRVAPESTAAHRYGCLIVVEVPGVPRSEWPVHTHLLQVMWEAEHLGGYWGCSHLWEDYDPNEPGVLAVAAALSPDGAAERAAAWLTEQLNRPLVVEEWDRRLLAAPVRRWVLSDTGQYVAGRRRRPRRGAPDRVVPVPIAD